MSANSFPPLFDHDLDPPRRPATELPAWQVGEYQRLVVNPFLAVLVMLMAFGGVMIAVRLGTLLGCWCAFAALFSGFWLIQFHCLDCGRTGWYSRARRHVCDAVHARWVDGRSAGWLPPRLSVQLWAWVVVILGLLVACWARVSS